MSTGLPISAADGAGPPPSPRKDLRDIQAEARRANELLRKLATQPPCIVLLGEGNSGKSTLANRLIGASLLPTSVLRNTRYPTLIRHADHPSLFALLRDGRRRPVDSADEIGRADLVCLELGLPSPRLLEYEVLDTPADTSLASMLGLIDPRAVPIPVWCTVATQAWKRSEQHSWLGVDHRLRRRGILAVTCTDRVGEPEQRERLERRLREVADESFLTIGFGPQAADRSVLAETVIAGVSLRVRERRRAAATRLSGRVAALASAALGGGEPSIVGVSGGGAMAP